MKKAGCGGMLSSPVLGSQGWGDPWASLASQPGIFDGLQVIEQSRLKKQDGQTVSVQQWSGVSTGLHVHRHT